MTPKQPNVIWITIDALRADGLGCYGNARPTSPFLDSIAEDGLVFENALAQSSWTLPSLASLMTSKHPPEIGMTSHNSRFPDDSLRAAEIFRDKDYQTAGFVTCDFLADSRGFAEGFDTYEVHPQNVRADKINQRVFEWLSSIDTEKPFFLWVHYYDVHADYNPPPPFDSAFGLSFAEKELGTTRCLQDVIKKRRSLSAEETAGVRLLYDQEINYLDNQLRLLWDRLKEKNILDNSVTAIASDHGEEFMEHGGTLHTTSLYEELVHVPLILRFPKRIPAGKRVATPVQNIDLLPTLLELCEIENSYDLRGQSLLTSFDTTQENSCCFSHLGVAEDAESFADWEPSIFKTLYMARKGADKIIYDPIKDDYEFYDLQRDSAETVNRYDENDPKCIELKNILTLWKDSLNVANAESVEMEREVLERLEALGYIE